MGYPADMALREAHTCSDEHLHPSPGWEVLMYGRLLLCEASFLLRLNSLPQVLQTPYL